MKNVISLFVEEVQSGGFFQPGFCRISVSDGERKIGSWLLTSSNRYSVQSELEEIKQEYEAAGYRAVGHWSLI